MTKRYYDSCIFGNANNPDNADHVGCLRATNVSDISWSIACTPELICSEFPSVKEFVDQFIIYCSISGVPTIQVELSDAKIAAKKNREHKKHLSQLGFVGHDWNHLMAAVFVGCEQIRTTDEDFFDSANKSTRGAAKKTNRVAKYITNKFKIDVLRP